MGCVWLVGGTMLCLDLVVAADPRQAGADGRCLAALLEAAAAAGYRTGLLPLRGAAHGHGATVATSLRPCSATAG